MPIWLCHIPGAKCLASSGLAKFIRKTKISTWRQSHPHLPPPHIYTLFFLQQRPWGNNDQRYGFLFQQHAMEVFRKAWLHSSYVSPSFIICFISFTILLQFGLRVASALCYYTIWILVVFSLELTLLKKKRNSSSGEAMLVFNQPKEGEKSGT